MRSSLGYGAIALMLCGSMGLAAAQSNAPAKPRSSYSTGPGNGPDAYRPTDRGGAAAKSARRSGQAGRRRSSPGRNGKLDTG